MNAFYKVNYMDLDGYKYTIESIEALNGYDAECIAAGIVNSNGKRYINFKAQFISL